SAWRDSQRAIAAALPRPRRRRCAAAGPTLSRLQYDAVGAQRSGDVFQILLAHIVDGDLELAADLLVGGGGEADATGLGDAFEARGDVDAVAEDVIAVGEDVTDIDADAEFDPPLGRFVG